MDAKEVLYVAAILCAAVSGGLVAVALFRAMRSKVQNQRVQRRYGVENSLIGSLLIKGISWLRYPAKVALRLSSVKAYAERGESALAHRGRRVSDEPLVSLLLGASIVVAFIATVLSASIVCGFALAVCVWLAFGLWANRQCDVRRELLREAIPEALQSMKACFQVGYSLAQTVRAVRKSTSGPLRKLFEEVEGVLEMGGSAEDALRVLKGKAEESELVFLATALEIQHKTGSSMQQILEITRQSVADEIELKRALKTQTAQAKLSAQIVTIMPFALIGIFSLVSPGFLDPFFESALGVVLLICALSMQVLGVSIVRRLLRVEVM